MRVCVCVCVCERERERERQNKFLKHNWLFPLLIHSNRNTEGKLQPTPYTQYTHAYI